MNAEYPIPYVLRWPIGSSPARTLTNMCIPSADPDLQDAILRELNGQLEQAGISDYLLRFATADGLDSTTMLIVIYREHFNIVAIIAALFQVLGKNDVVYGTLDPVGAIKRTSKGREKTVNMSKWTRMGYVQVHRIATT